MEKRVQPARPNTKKRETTAASSARGNSIVERNVIDRSLSGDRRREPDTYAPTKPSSRQPPIFVHSGFRTSSTWLWKKFRDSPNTLAYSEIFHEDLSRIDSRTASTSDYNYWRSRHPESAPYFLEYLPLLKESGGVYGYEPSMEFKSFIPEGGLDGRLTRSEASYVDRLLSHASDSQKIPVLTCTRTLGRMAALKREFGGTHILLHRNIFHQWASYSGQAINGNGYFIATLEKTIKASRHDRFLCAIDDWFHNRKAAYYDSQMFIVFLLYHLYLYANNYHVADIIIDVTNIARSALYRNTAEDEISRLCHSQIDLSDVEINFDSVDLRIPSKAAFIDTIEQFSRFVIGVCKTDDSVAFVDQLKSSAMSEWAKFEFFNGGSLGAKSSKVSRIADHAAPSDPTVRPESGEIEDAKGRLVTSESALEKSKVAFAAMEADRDRLVARLEGQASVLATSDRALAAVEADRDRLALRLEGYLEGQGSLTRALAAMTADRDRLVANVAEHAAVLEKTETALDAMTADRDRLIANVAEHAVMLDRARAAVAHVERDRDELKVRLSDMTSNFAAADNEFAAMELDRRRLVARLDEAISELAASKSALATTLSDGDSLAQRLSEAESALNIANNGLAAMSVERERLTEQYRRHIRDLENKDWRRRLGIKTRV